jgi:hypothetical protein
VLSIASRAGRERCVMLACLDHERRPLTLAIVDDAPEELPCIDVLLLAGASAVAASAVAALVVGSSRPGASVMPGPGDAETLAEMSARCQAGGIELVEWFILADGQASAVGEIVGRAGRW